MTVTLKSPSSPDGGRVPGCVRTPGFADGPLPGPSSRPLPRRAGLGSRPARTLPQPWQFMRIRGWRRVDAEKCS
jgi:hypothetical protein